jgi:hypothetical protein
MSQIVYQTILDRLTLFRLVIQDFAHPEPRFSEHIVVVADVHGAI